MDIETHQNALKELRAKVRNQGLIITVLSLAVLGAVIGWLSVLGSERTVVTPPTLSKSFWVDGHKVSPAYLEEMGSFVAWLILDVSPASIDWKKDMLLNYVSPDQFGPLQTRQNLEAERLKRLNAATYFSPQQVVVRDKDQLVEIRGRLKTQVNGQETTTESKAYAAQFKYAGGRIHLETFKEIPYESKPLQAAAGSSDQSAN